MTEKFEGRALRLDVEVWKKDVGVHSIMSQHPEIWIMLHKRILEAVEEADAMISSLEQERTKG